ncbi:MULTISPECIES: LPXTG cell wall anchor domain-containing protein [unclassified Enterococcus]|uniref:LPXTG cell wall anchor domain-containing protein n=1 Tax=unclassified Enterococcus TaxID=2608891 RepID=UPI0013EBD14B|nr:MULTISPECIES: LPXTG cell wall anchor domain-containing protein [unclassified Enterococcus]
MGKLVSYVVVFFTVFMFALPVDAVGAISDNEQRILNELNEPVRIQEKEFTVPTKDVTQAENYLKQNELTNAQVEIVVSNIQSVKTLLTSLTVDLSGVSTLDDLIKALPRDVIVQIQQHVTAAANALGLVVLSWNQGDIQFGVQNSDGTTSPAFSSKQAVKQTGASFASSFIAVGALLFVAAGAFVISKKTKLA